MDKGTKLSKWCPAGRVSQRLTFKDRGVKSLKSKKKKKKSHRKKYSSKDDDGPKEKKLLSRESQARLELQVNVLSI